MAIPWTVKVTVLDADQEIGSFSFNLGSVLDLAGATSAAQSIIAAIDPLIDGVIQAATITNQIDLSGQSLKSAVTAQTDRLVGGRFIFSSAENFKTMMTLPTFDTSTYVPAGSENIDTANVDVAAFLAACTGTTLTTKQDNECNTVDKAYEVYGGKK